jgi:hypothetical protein
MQNQSRHSHGPTAALSAGETNPEPLFPQRFTPFEFYFYLEDRPDYPSVFPIRLECRGQLDAEAFERAYQITHARHPLLSAQIEDAGRSRPVWTAGVPAPICWKDGPIASEAEPMVLPPSARLQVEVNRDGERTVVCFAFHHVAVDGLGAFQFISDLMVAYAHACSGAAGLPPWRPLDRELLRDRDGHSLTNRKITLIDLVRVAPVSSSLLLRRVAVVSNRDMPPTPRHDVAVPDFLVHTLTEHETAELSRIARKLSVRLNDLLLRDYFLMLADWNAGTAEARRPLRVIVPTNLRRKQDYLMPAANVFGYVFLTRRARDCRERARLLDSICRELAMMKRARWAIYHKAGLRLFCKWPRLLRWSLRRKWPFATAIFSNLNAGFDHTPLPWRDGLRAAGELVVENGYGASPVRPDTRVSLAIHKYAGRMSFSVRCDPQLFGSGEQRVVLQAYLDRLQMTIQSES